MSLIKLAYEMQQNPIFIVNHNTDGNSSKTLNKRNFAAAGVGATLGFGAKEAVDHLKGFNKEKILHRYGSRMAGVGGAMLGAGATFAYMKKHSKDQAPDMFMY